MGYVDRFIKGIHLENNIYNKSKEEAVISNLEPGDIIWARRYSKEEVKKNIELEHREGPFIVIYKDKLNIVYCLSCSSKEDTKFMNILKLSSEDYPNCFYRDTYVKLNKPIEMTNYRFIRLIGVLSKKTLNHLKKTLFLEMKNEKISNLFNFSRNKLIFYLECGDIIRNQGDYYLISEHLNKNELLAYRVIKNKNDYDMILNDIPIRICYNKKVILNSNEKYSFMGIYHKNVEYYLKEKKTSFGIPNIGALISIDKDLYLIHSKLDNYWVVIKIFSSTKGIGANSYHITIHNKPYLTAFKFQLLPIEYQYNILDYCLEFEIPEYLYKIEKYNLSDNLEIDDKIFVPIEKYSSINLSSLQNTIIAKLEKLNYSFLEIVEVMLVLRNTRHQFIFNNYLDTITLEKATEKYIKKITKNTIENIIKNLVIQRNKNTFNSINVGDIIWARDDNTSESPYIIIYTDNNSIYGIKGGFYNKNNSGLFFKYTIDYKEKLNGSNIRFKLSKPLKITEENLIKAIDSLSESEKNRMIKKLYVALSKSLDFDFPFSKEELTYYISLYDVVKYKKSYYFIFDEDNSYFFSYPAHISNKSIPYLYINSIGYDLDLNTIKKLSKINNYEVVNVLKEKVLNVYRNKKKWKDKDLPVPFKSYLNNTEKVSAKRGDIILLNKQHYLVFGEYKNNYQVYELFEENEINPNLPLCKIKIDKAIFFTYFDAFTIEKDNKFTVLSSISEEYLKEINNIRKTSKKFNSNYIKPLETCKEKELQLNNTQLELISKLQELSFSKEEICAILVTLTSKPIQEEVLCYIDKMNTNFLKSKEDIILKITEIIQA